MKKFLLSIYRNYTFKYMFDFEEEPDVEEWKEFLDSLPAATDDYIMSYNKYLCRMWYFPGHYKFFMNIVSVFLFIAYTGIVLINNLKGLNTKNVDLVLIKATNVDYEDIFPEDLEKKYNRIEAIEKVKPKDFHLNSQSLKILLKCILKHPLSVHYNVHIFQELGRYSYVQKQFNTKAVACYVNERNIASPLVTQMLEAYGMKYITFMHGEYLLQLIQGYMKFTEFYVWDEHYIEMFVNDLNCPPEQFRVYTPKKYTKEYSKTNEEYFCTYYFGAESIKRIKKVSEVFQLFKEQGYKCKVRPHPRRSNYDAINKYFKDFVIEDTKQVSTDESIETSKHIIGLNSTVLSEAYYGGKSIVIDNVSEPERYKSLFNRKYILLSKPHTLLSKLIKEAQ